MLDVSEPSSATRGQRLGDRLTNMSVDNEEALSIIDDFNEIIQSEVLVDMERLRILARRGVPNQLRGEVWKFLLGIEQADRSKELSSSKAREEEYKQIDKTDPDISKRIRGEVSRYQRRTPELNRKHFTERFENVIIAYLNANRDADYNPALISLCAPFVFALDKEYDAYFCFERLMQHIDEYYISHSIKEQVANFMTLFRYVLPDLCNYFEEEEVDLNEWATSWLQHLLSKELKFENLLRLWDSYFSIHDSLEFHSFVCLAILRHTRENLEDLEQSEIRTMLLRLPFMDMRRIFMDAFNLRHETLEREMFENEEDG